MLDMNYFRAVQNSTGIQSKTEAKIIDAQTRLKRELKKSINYKSNALRNDEAQDILLVPNTKAKYKCDIIAFPNEELYVGDIIYVDELYWIVVETNVTNPVQTIGTAWLCNHLFRFQNYSSEILEYWGVIDDGSYALPQTGNTQITYLNNRVNFYLPYNDDTKYLYIDKRIATDTIYDKNGKNILEVYVIEGKKQSLSTYGKGGHLLVLEAVSGQYSEEKDNLKEGICDYIESSGTTEVPKDENLLDCAIQGRSTIRAGGIGTYTVEFYDENGSAVENGITAEWSLETEINGVVLTSNGLTAQLVIDDIDDVVGETILLCCQDDLKKYNLCSFEIEVM